MTETTQSTAVVEEMLVSLRGGDIERAMSCMDERIVWHNVGLPKVRGANAVARYMRALAKPGYGFDVTIHNIAADGDIVLTERTDALIWRRLRIEFWVCGTFELRDGKIAVWRDYFDNVDFFKGVARGLLRAM